MNSLGVPKVFKKTDMGLFDFIDRSIPVLIGIFLFFNPFPHTTSIKEISFYSALILVSVLVFRKKIEFTLKTPLFFPLMLFTLWSFLMLEYAIDKGNSIHDFRTHLLRYIVLYYILINFFTSRKSLEAISWIIIVSTVLASVCGLYYDYFVLGKSFSERFGLDFTEINTNQIGVLSVFATILCLHNIKVAKSLYLKIGTLFLACLLAVNMFFTQTRSSLLSLCLSALVLFPRSKKAFLVLIVSFIIVIFITPVGDRIRGSIHEPQDRRLRFHQFMLELEVVKDYLFTGTGFGLKNLGDLVDLDTYNKRMLKKPHPKEYEKYDQISHSLITSVAARTGIVGLVLFMYILFVVLKMCWSTLRESEDEFVKNWSGCVTASLLSFFIIGLFESVFFHMAEVVIFTIFGMATIVWRLNRMDSEEVVCEKARQSDGGEQKDFPE